MATKRLTFEEAIDELRGGERFVWALNYDPNGVPGDWDAMTGMVEWDELAKQYGPFVLTTEGEDEAIDATVLTLDEQIQYESDRVENWEELGIEERDAKMHLRDLMRPDPLGAVGRIEFFIGIFDDVDPTLAAAVDVLYDFVRTVNNEGAVSLEWGEPGSCSTRQQLDPDENDGRHYGLPHCIWCLQAT